MDWLAGLRGGSAGSAGGLGTGLYAPYMQKAPSYYSPFTAGTTTQPSATTSNLGNLYRNVFNREADPSGLAFWEGQQKAGMSLGDIANYFTHSPEAVKQYGASGIDNLSSLINSSLAPNATTQPYKDRKSTRLNSSH